MKRLSCIELCAGAGGQALGLEQAGFAHQLLVDIEERCSETLRLNRPNWHVIHADIRALVGNEVYPKGVDLLAGGLPCPPFSVAGKQLGENDERDLFPTALRIIEEVQPRGVMIENVRGFLSSAFEDYRERIRDRLRAMGYEVDWRLLNASDFGVPQLRPRVTIVALLRDLWPGFKWPEPAKASPPAVGDVLYDLMAAGGWEGADTWAKQASKIAPTIVGGSTKHGGPDLGPTRAKRAWEEMGVNGRLVALEPPSPGFEGMPYLTVRMVARLQGFPDDWKFSGRKTAAYRQVGNAFPPPVARAVATRIARVLGAAEEQVRAAV